MKLSPMRKACAMPAGLGCSRYSRLTPNRAAVAEQLAEARQVVRRGNQAKLADAALDERGERVIHHRFVIHRLELFARDQRERIQPRTRAPGEDDAFHFAKSVKKFRANGKWKLPN